jgi:DTW domain-containing protein YfiP
MSSALICEVCFKPSLLCICEQVRPVATRARVLILQHPQEPDKEIGSARAAHLTLEGSVLKVGLSWRSLQHALGDEEVDPKRFAVLSLAGAQSYAATLEALPDEERVGDRLVLVDRKGMPLANRAQILPGLQGLVALDGTWSQAKTLWWRNAWLLKLRRAVVIPAKPSLYGRLRREPRRECVSTLEAIAAALVGLGEPQEVSDSLLELFTRQLDLLREVGWKPPSKRRAGRRPRRGGAGKKRHPKRRPEG